MNTKNKVLSVLNKNVGKTVSSSELSLICGVGRNSIWKAINSLKGDGCEIESSSQGYTLKEYKEGFFSESIQQYLKSPRKIIVYDEKGSSNTVAKELAMAGEPEGTVVVVISQTAGKGRMGRSFLSKSENGLYMSIILRPKIPIDKCVQITVLGASATLEAIEESSKKECQIKWVNDIYIDKKKVCGILTEASYDFESGGVEYAVIGIGINLLPPKGGFDSEIKDIATSIFESEMPRDYKSLLCAKIIDNFFDGYAQLEKREYLKKYKEKSFLIGKEVELSVGKETISGTVVDIDSEARIVLKTDKGEYAFNSGDARIKK